MLNRTLPATALFFAGLLGCAALHAAALPDFTATYKLSRGALTIGTSRIALTREPDGGYHYDSHSWPTRWVAWLLKEKLHETSSGHLDENGPRPDKYHYLRTGGKKERVAHLTFDWGTRIVVNNVAGSRWKMDIPVGTQDKLSMSLGMMQALARGEEDFSFDIADGGKLKKYRFKVLGEETLELPTGMLKTVKVVKLRNDNPRKTFVWCAPELNYLPVRIWQREKDDTEYMSELESFSESVQLAAEE
jgi:hypothetical protein